eukprot:3920654-Pyramimonas_sp.AAC.1
MRANSCLSRSSAVPLDTWSKRAPSAVVAFSFWAVQMSLGQRHIAIALRVMMRPPLARESLAEIGSR